VNTTIAISTLSYTRQHMASAALIAALSQQDTAALGRIETLLSNASQAYVKRRYQEATRDYLQAESLIYAQLNPGYRGGMYGRLPRDFSLFRPLMTVALGWMNVLPVPGPPSPVRSLDQIHDPGPLYSAVGLGTTTVSSPAEHQAAADVRQAAILTAQGNSSAARMLEQRAAELAGNLAREMQRLLAPVAPNLGGAYSTGSTTPRSIDAPIPGTAENATRGITAADFIQAGQVVSRIGENTSTAAVPGPLTAQRTLGIVVQDAAEAGASVQTVSWAAGARL
jgi:hypothetical protein